MPGLVAFNRRWGIGSDDLVFPGLGEIIIRLIWLVVVAVVFNIHDQDAFKCTSANLLEVFYIGVLVINSVSIVHTGVFVITCMQGGVMEVTKRRHVPTLLYIKLALFLPELAWVVLGTYWAFADYTGCTNYVVIVVRVMAVLAWLIMLGIMVGIAIVFDPLGSHGKMDLSPQTLTQENPLLTDRSSATKRLWETRCKILCCCVRRDEQSRAAFSDIAQLFTDFFQGNDLVATDIACGLILVQAFQHGSPRPSPLQGTEDSVQDVGPARVGREVRDISTYPNPKPWMTVSRAAFYMNFAAASYGWPLYMYMNLPLGCCNLTRDSSCCHNSDLEGRVVDDNCCQSNTAVIRLMTNVEEEDIIYASYHNKVYEIPFFVVLDHQNNAVVISIRGTLSLRDALTDMTAESEHVEEAGLSPEGKAHKGILRAARFIAETIHDKQLLEKAFQRGQGYDLVIVGHSLGAGAAALLSVLLKSRYPALMCFAYSPPGGLLSLPLARYTEDFVLSVVVGEDLIPRLGLKTGNILKSEVLSAISNSSKPKYKILASGCWNFVCSCIRTPDEEGPTARPLLAESRTRPRSYSQDVDIESGPSSQQTVMNEALYPPGHIMHIQELTAARVCFGGVPDYSIVWARSETFDEIIVSTKMVSHHLPDVVLQALNQLYAKDMEPQKSGISNRAQDV